MTSQDPISQQIPIDLARPPSFDAADFVPTPANETALAFLDRWPDWPQTGAILVGPSGAGKSHLATMLHARAPGSLLLGLSDLNEELTQQEEDPPLIIFDHGDGDAQFDEDRLFHIINHYRLAARATGRLLFLSRKPPQQWGVKLPDLQSRLNACDIIRIDQPDDFSLEVLLQKLFADKRVSVDQNVIAYLLKRMPRSYHAARLIVDRMDEIGLVQKAKLTRKIAAQVIDELAAQDRA